VVREMANRFVILADVHVSVTETPGTHANTRYTAGLLRKAVNSIAKLTPERVVILGDLINTGDDREYTLVKQILEPIADRIEPMLGNHELLFGTTVDFKRQWNVEPARRMFIGGVSCVLLNSGIDGLPIQQYQGSISQDQLNMVQAASEEAPKRPLAVFCHHPLRGTVRLSDEPMIGLDNSEDLRGILESHPGPVMFFSAHRHYQSVVNIDRPGRSPIVCVGLASLLHWPHAYLVVEARSKQWDVSMARLIDVPELSPDMKALDSAYRHINEGAATDQNVSIHF
jgi:3',5'-cyclic-AMP phosphodiesterase